MTAFTLVGKIVQDLKLLKSTMYLHLSQQLEPLSLLKNFIKLMGSLGFALVVFGLFLIFTPQGSRIALYLISDLTPYQLRFGSLEGTLAHHLELHDVVLNGPKLALKAAELKITWHFLDFFKPHKKCQSLKVKKLRIWYEGQNTISHQPSLEEIQAALKKALPFAIKVEHLAIQDAHFYWNEIEHQLSELTIHGASTTLSQIEEIHYQGAFGSLNAYFQDAIIINWDLRLTKNPYLVTLHSSPIITKGSILLPSRNLADPQNQLEISLKCKDLIHKAHFENIHLDIKGTLAKHHIHLLGGFAKHPFESKMNGQFTKHSWQGNIKKLILKDEKLQKIGNTTGSAYFNWANKAIISHLHLILDQSYPIDIQASMDKKAPFDLKGSLNTQISNINALSSFVPSFNTLKGKLTVNLTLGGNLFNPQWTGKVLLTDAKVRATTFSKKAFLNDLQFSLLSDNKLDIKGKGSFGSGRFEILGQGNLKTPFIELSFKGEQLLLSDTPEYYIIANPDLKLTLQNKLILLSGKIFIPQGQIQSLKNPDMISPSQDVVIIDKNHPNKSLTEPELTRLLKTNIELILGDKITYKGNGLFTKLDGKLFISQEPSQPPDAQGKLILKNGKYKAYGKVFDIDYGQILFTGGPIYDPIIEIRAQRIIQPETTLGPFEQTQAILAGITLSGHLKTPKISFFSNPSMNDADIISYLIVGRPQNKMNEAQAEILFQAVSELAHILGGSRKDVRFDLAEKLKLDQLGFAKKPNYIPSPGSHNPLEDTVFVLGKQLSERLYLNYSVGLLDSASQIGMRIVLGKNLMIEAATGTQGSSADVLLSLEGR